MARLLVKMNPIKIETATYTMTTQTAYWFDFDKLIKTEVTEVTIAEYENSTFRKYMSEIFFNSIEDLTIEYFRVKEIKELI